MLSLAWKTYKLTLRVPKKTFPRLRTDKKSNLPKLSIRERESMMSDFRRGGGGVRVKMTPQNWTLFMYLPLYSLHFKDKIESGHPTFYVRNKPRLLSSANTII